MYILTLSAADRAAIDWIGNRYAHGDDLFKLLWSECHHRPEYADWDYSGDISFEVPEHIAWAINEIGEEGAYCWDCFADDLSTKLTEFCMNVV